MMAAQVEAGAPFVAGPVRAPRKERLWVCRRGRKHKMGGKEPEGVPLPKKRMTEEAGPFLIGGWSPLPAPPPSEVPPPTCESVEMEETATLRRLREIEERIIDDEDDDENDSLAKRDSDDCHVGLPTLVLSEALKASLRRQRQDFHHEGDGLTKRILESMSRPSMEVVLWKPLPSTILKASSSSTSSLPLLYGNADCAVEEEMEL